MKKGYTLISPCFFGMEKMLANEIKNLGFEIVKTEDGRVTYKTDEYGIAKANMWLRIIRRDKENKLGKIHPIWSAIPNNKSVFYKIKTILNTRYTIYS